MKNFTTGIMGFLAGLVIFFSLSLSLPEDKRVDSLINSSSVMEETICSMKNEFELELDSLKEVLKDPYLMAYRYKQDRAKFLSYLNEEKEFPSTPFVLRPQIAKRAEITTELLAALIALGQNPTAPKEDLIVSSALRSWNHKSHHFSGNAIDISYTSANSFLEWLKTDEGILWMEDYGLQVYIEDNRRSKFLASWSFLSNMVFLNPSATGPHVHIAYIGRKEKMIRKES